MQATLRLTSGARSPGAEQASRGDALVLWLLPVFAAVIGLVMPLYPTDFFVNLRLGEVALEQHQIPLRPQFSHAPVEASAINAAWLAQVVFALTHRAAGLPGLVLLQALLIAGVFTCLVRVCYQRTGRATPAALAACASMVVGMPMLTLRPQLFSVALLSVFLMLLSRPGGRLTYVVLPILSVLWSNLHGGFVLGPVVVGAFLVGALGEAMLSRGSMAGRLVGAGVPRMAMLLVLVVAGTFLNPYGPGLYSYVWGIGSHPVVRASVTEWQPPAIHDQAGGLLVASMLLVALALALARLRLRLADAVLLTLFGAMAAVAMRNAVWWAMASAPVLAMALARLSWFGGASAAPSRGGRIRRFASLGVGVCLVLLALPWWKEASPILPDAQRGLLSSDTPVEAAEFLRGSSDSGRVFNEMSWGGYLAWRLWPRFEVYTDNLIEAYPLEVWRDYFAIRRADPGWEDLLGRYGVRYAVLDRSKHASLVAAMASSPSWREAYADPLAVIYLRE